MSMSNDLFIKYYEKGNYLLIRYSRDYDGSKRHSIQAVEPSQRLQIAGQIVSKALAPSNGILDGNVISWHNGVRHLGNFFNSRLDINVDTNHKCSHFIGHFNHMMSNFGHLNPESVGTLFKSYCCSFYGSFLWKYNSDSFGKCCTQWNKCIRRIYSLPYKMVFRTSNGQGTH